MSRTHWEDIPGRARAAVEAAVGRVLKAETVEGGIMPGTAARLHLEDSSSVFLKAIHSTHPGAMLHRREAWAAVEAAVMPSGASGAWWMNRPATRSQKSA
jgi:hypothetical protein